MARIDTLELDFRAIVDVVIAETELTTSRKWGVVQARRTMAEQEKIYAQGRTAPGEIVSNAPPGSSAHNYGEAVDLCPMKGTEFDWKAPDDLFHIMADIAEKHGLVAGYYFKSITDKPHIESATWRERRALWKAGKLTIS